MADSTRGAPASSCTAGNLDSTRYVDLEATRPPPPSVRKLPDPIPSTSYAAIAASKPTTPKPPTQVHRNVPPPRPKGRAQEELRRHPPIMVEALSNWPRHMAAIRERLGRAPSARPFGTGFRFLPSSAEEYRADHAAVDRRCPVYRKKARMMGVTVPPPVPPVPPVRRSGNAAPSAVAPTSKGKGKGKGKSSQPQPPPTSSFIPPAVTVEAEPSAATLMAEANTPRRGKPTPTPRSFAITRPTPKQDRAPARAGAPTPQAPNKKTLKNRKKKSKRKLMKKARREALENAAPSSVPAIPAIDMEVDINPTTDHIIDDQQPGSSSLPQAQPATSEMGKTANNNSVGTEQAYLTVELVL
uniref:Uncharacterized protein n=1 Tax=Bombyx mori TaxID=7091 RepID=A0A8R2M565_BOMMO|nr:serine/arginine repetitive matrix protein 1-like [Bombyx mori]